MVLFFYQQSFEYHIGKNSSFDDNFKQRLLHSFYVDYTITSVHNEKELQYFVSNSKTLVVKGGCHLRRWEYTGNYNENLTKEEIQVLSLIWNKILDTLKSNMH